MTNTPTWEEFVMWDGVLNVRNADGIRRANVEDIHRIEQEAREDERRKVIQFIERKMSPLPIRSIEQDMMDEILEEACNMKYGDKEM